MSVSKITGTLAVSTILALLPSQALAVQTAAVESSETITTEQVQQAVQAAINELPEDATEAQIQAVIGQVVAQFSSEPAIVSAALLSVAQNNSSNANVYNALVGVSNSVAQSSPSNTSSTSGTQESDSDNTQTDTATNDSTAGNAPAQNGNSSVPAPASSSGGSDY